jgi:hypothetical protein
MLSLAWSLRILAVLLAAFAARIPASSESFAPGEQKEAIDRLVEALKSTYVFPDVAERMSTSIRERQAKGEYDAIQDPEVFAKTLTDQLQTVCHDKHLRIRSEGSAADAAGPRRGFPESDEEFRRLNFGFERVERLPGNIGYVDLRMFAPAGMTGETAAGAMNFLANTDALVIDLRRNGGGQPDMVQLFCSYLFGPEPVHLNDLYFRPMDQTRQFWTLPWLPGKRYLEKDVYVLTSHSTFSGAEECAYDLQTQKRAQIVGETTGGGANPGGRVELTKHLSAFVPSGRAINPVTGKNWEGTGVVPDVQVEADRALDTARSLALKKLVDGCQEPDRRQALAEELQRVEHELATKKQRGSAGSTPVGLPREEAALGLVDETRVPRLPSEPHHGLARVDVLVEREALRRRAEDPRSLFGRDRRDGALRSRRAARRARAVADARATAVGRVEDVAAE